MVGVVRAYIAIMLLFLAFLASYAIIVTLNHMPLALPSLQQKKMCSSTQNTEQLKPTSLNCGINITREQSPQGLNIKQQIFNCCYLDCSPTYYESRNVQNLLNDYKKSTTSPCMQVNPNCYKVCTTATTYIH